MSSLVSYFDFQIKWYQSAVSVRVVKIKVGVDMHILSHLLLVLLLISVGFMEILCAAASMLVVAYIQWFVVLNVYL